jgi:hypothetical protein
MGASEPRRLSNYQFYVFDADARMVSLGAVSFVASARTPYFDVQVDLVKHQQPLARSGRMPRRPKGLANWLLSDFKKETMRFVRYPEMPGGFNRILVLAHL